MPNHDIIVIGTSAGGVESLSRLVATLPADLPAALFVVMHLSPESPSQLPEILAKKTSLRVLAAVDQAPIEHGRIYVASPDRHLLVERGRMRVMRGPKENRHRPAVDPLFRSAAWSYGPQVVGVVLSGTLDDGAAGLWAIRSCGGIAIVQDPADALFPGMPASAILSMDVDHRQPLDRIGLVLTLLAHEPIAQSEFHRPEKLKIETEFAAMERDITDMSKLGRPSPFTCPACRGALWELQEGNRLRYRCHTGHAFSADSLLAEQSEAIEQALYSAMRALEEKAAAYRRMSEQLGNRYPNLDQKYQSEARELVKQANEIRRMLAPREA